METLCACAFPQAVNQCDDRYHCDYCGYALGPDDRRIAILQRISLAVWMMVTHHAQGYRSPLRAWEYIDRQIRTASAAAVAVEYSPPPLFHQIRFRTRFVSFDPERE